MMGRSEPSASRGGGGGDAAADAGFRARVFGGGRLVVTEAEAGFVDGDENLEDGETLVRALKAHEPGPRGGRLLCAAALVVSSAAGSAGAAPTAGLAHLWIGDSLEPGVSPNAVVRAAQHVVDCLLLEHLRRGGCADALRAHAPARSASRVALRSRGFVDVAARTPQPVPAAAAEAEPEGGGLGLCAHAATVAYTACACAHVEASLAEAPSGLAEGPPPAAAGPSRAAPARVARAAARAAARSDAEAILRALAAAPPPPLALGPARALVGAEAAAGGAPPTLRAAALLCPDSRTRHVWLLPDFATEAEVAALRGAADAAPYAADEPDSVDLAPAQHCLLLDAGRDAEHARALPPAARAAARALGERLARALRSLVPGGEQLVLSDAFLRRYGRGAGGRRGLPPHFDSLAFATAALDLTLPLQADGAAGARRAPCDAGGASLFVQAGAAPAARRRVPFGACGRDVFVHGFDVAHGVARADEEAAASAGDDDTPSRRLSLLYWFAPSAAARAAQRASWLSEGAAAGDGDLLFCLGGLLECGSGGHAHDEAAAEDLYARAAAGSGGAGSGNAWAQTRLGSVREAQGRDADAVRWWGEAARQGSPLAQLALADAHEAGAGGLEGGTRGAVRARLWLRLAAAAGCEEADEAAVPLTLADNPAGRRRADNHANGRGARDPTVRRE